MAGRQAARRGRLDGSGHGQDTGRRSRRRRLLAAAPAGALSDGAHTASRPPGSARDQAIQHFQPAAKRVISIGLRLVGLPPSGRTEPTFSCGQTSLIDVVTTPISGGGESAGRSGEQCHGGPALKLALCGVIPRTLLASHLSLRIVFSQMPSDDRSHCSYRPGVASNRLDEWLFL